MGIFDFLRSKPGPSASAKPVVPRTKRTPAERKLIAEAKRLANDERYLRKLEASANPEDREIYRKIMLGRIGAGLPKEDDLEKLAETFRRLRDLGFDPMGAAEREDDGSKELLLGLIQAFGPVIAQRVAGVQLPTAPSAPTATVAPAPAQPALAEPAPASATPLAAPAQPVAQPSLQPALVETVVAAGHSNGVAHVSAQQVVLSSPLPKGLKSVKSVALITALAEKTPDEAASWLASQAATNPEYNQLLEELKRKPDEHLVAWLQAFAAVNPSLGEFVDWLTPQWPWLVETISIVRKRTQGD